MTPEEETTAQYRFLGIALVRVVGAVLLVTGLAIIARGDIGPKALGYFLFIAGLTNFMLVPRYLARRWKSPPPQ
jgi:hypothetical protein